MKAIRQKKRPFEPLESADRFLIAIRPRLPAAEIEPRRSDQLPRSGSGLRSAGLRGRPRPADGPRYLPAFPVTVHAVRSIDRAVPVRLDTLDDLYYVSPYSLIFR